MIDRVYIRFERSMKEKLKTIAKGKNRSINHVIINIIRRYLVEYEKDLNKINGVDS